MRVDITHDENNLIVHYNNITLRIDKQQLFEVSQKEYSEEEIKNHILFLSRTKTINELKEVIEI